MNALNIMKIEIGDETKTILHLIGDNVNRIDLAEIDQAIELYDHIYACDEIVLSKELSYVITHSKRLHNDQIREIFIAEIETAIQTVKDDIQNSLDKINKKLEGLKND